MGKSAVVEVFQLLITERRSEARVQHTSEPLENKAKAGMDGDTVDNK